MGPDHVHLCDMGPDHVQNTMVVLNCGIEICTFFEDSETLDRKIDGSGFQIIENIMRKAAATFSEP